jgi:Protein of unknown function (DUF1186)/SEC-C motif
MTTEALADRTQIVELDLDGLIRELDAGMDRLPEAALRTCQKHRELVTPRLIEVLQEAVRLGREGIVREGNAHFFALFLLTEFEAKEALQVILELYSLRDPVLDSLLGGAVTETTRRVLAILAGDQPDLIESLVANQQLDDFVRWEAAAALCQLVRDGRMPRADGLGRLVRQLRSAAAANDTWGVTIVICELDHLNPLEYQDEIKTAFDRKLVDESITSWSCITKYSLHPDQPGTCPDLANWRPGAITDTVEELQEWHCFSDAARQDFSAPLERAAPLESPDFGDDFEVLDTVERDDSGFGTIRREAPRVGRNDPCPCGSGKKYKKCCMQAGEDS